MSRKPAATQDVANLKQQQKKKTSKQSGAASQAAKVEDHIPVLETPICPDGTDTDLDSGYRVIPPSVVKNHSRLDTVTSTISVLTAHANRGWSSLVAASSGQPPVGTVSTSSEPMAWRDGAISPVYDAFENAGDLVHESNTLLDGLASVNGPRNTVEWSRWDHLRIGSRLVPVLISFYISGTLQMLQVDGDDMKEVLSISAFALQHHAERYTRPPPQVLSACCRPSARAEVLIVIGPSPELLVYSLETHEVQTRLPLVGPDAMSSAVSTEACDMQCNERFTCIALTAPASVHVLRTDTLQYAVGPLTDVGMPSRPGPPIMSLSGRLLAYSPKAKVGQVSEIVSDARRPTAAANSSATLARDGGRSRSGTHGQASSGMGDVREQMMETSAQVGDVARRVSGNVLSGMRTLGEWGSSYLPGASLSPPASGPGQSQHTSQPHVQGPSGLLSRSAPISGHLSQRPASSVSSSPRLAPVQDGSRPQRSSLHADRDREPSPGVSTAVRIIDLASSGRTIATFVPSTSAVAHIALSPNGQFCLTADSLGHAFHVFEVQAAGSFGVRDAREGRTPLLHRYKLLRGITSAEVVGAQWSKDAQWLAVSTRTGTVHVYSLNPYGGPASIANHVTGKVRNAASMPPLSITVNSILRTARPTFSNEDRAKTDSAHPHRSHNGSFETSDQAGDDLADGQRKAAAPAFMMLGASQSPEGNLFAPRRSGSHTFDILTFDPRSVSISLHKVEMSSSVQSGGEAHACQPGGIAGGPPGSSPATAATIGGSSGLTQMMRRAGGGLLHGASSEPRLSGDCHRIAAWNGIAPRLKSNEVRVMLTGLPAHEAKRRQPAMLLSSRNAIAKAEIETYSQSPRVLPASVYLSRQCFFRTFDELLGDAVLLAAIHRAPSRPLPVRDMATIVETVDDDTAYDDRLAGALDELAFDDSSLQAQSPSSHIPSFPQGYRAKTAGWASRSIPIRSVAGGIGGGLYRAGRELSRGVEMARKRTGANPGPLSRDRHARQEQQPQPTSLSFDGDDGDVDMFSDLRDRQRPESATSIVSRAQPSLRFGRGSQPSSAETPPTDFSLGSAQGEGGAKVVGAGAGAGFYGESLGIHGGRGGDEEEERGAEDELDWDSFADPEVVTGQGNGLTSDVGRQVHAGSGTDLREDFTVGYFDEEDDVLDGTGGRSGSLLRAQSPGSDATASPKGLVYTLRGGGAGAAGRSSLFATSTMATAESTPPEGPEVERDKSPAPSSRSDAFSSSESSGGGSGSTGESAASGHLCEGNKETHTSAPRSTVSGMPSIPGGMPENIAVSGSGLAAAAAPTSSGGGSKKKKRGKR